MRILLVAPDSDLAVLAELIAAAGENQPTILHGNIGHRELLASLRGSVYDIIHFAGHGQTMRLTLSDGELSTEMLISSLDNQKRPNLIFLNACKSLSAAAQLYRHGANYVIGWRDDVSDTVAGEFAVAFYNTLKLNAHPHRAFDIARRMMTEFHPGAEQPVILNGRMLSLEDEIAKLRSQIEEGRDDNFLIWRLATIGAGVLGLVGLVLALLR